MQSLHSAAATVEAMHCSQEEDEGRLMLTGNMLLDPKALLVVERYDGQADALTWLDSVSSLASLYGWDDEVTLSVAKLRLKGPARRWLKRQRFTSWNDFQSQFLGRFGETRESAVSRLGCCFQQPGESPQEFADRFLQAADRAGRVEDAALLYQFLCQLLPDLRMEEVRTQPGSIDEAVQYCNYWLGFTDAEASDQHGQRI
jgi:hypothetical protein